MMILVTVGGYTVKEDQIQGFGPVEFHDFDMFSPEAYAEMEVLMVGNAFLCKLTTPQILNGSADAATIAQHMSDGKKKRDAMIKQLWP